MVLTTDQKKTLKRLYRCKNSKRRFELIKQGGPELQHLIRECCHNVLRGTVPLTDRQRNKLKKIAPQIRQLAKKSTPLRTRLATEQKGGILLPLLAPIVQTILPVLGRALSEGFGGGR